MCANLQLLTIICGETSHLTPHLTPGVPLGCPKMGQILEYVRNVCHHQIYHEKLCICADFQLVIIIYEIDNFLPFLPFGLF